jgi:hypothetical protein
MVDVDSGLWKRNDWNLSTLFDLMKENANINTMTLMIIALVGKVIGEVL